MDVKDVVLVGNCENNTILGTVDGSLMYSGMIYIPPSKISTTNTFDVMMQAGKPFYEDIQEGSLEPVI